ncbi:MAG: putative acetyltransferase [Chloroflexi bacterium ADurb.Bin325]|nr:MAG: putative acetyltransferase [Chloroflexi bacterium ADurb.Bin325]
MITLTTFQPQLLPALVAFLNRALAGHRHWTAISEADFTERVLSQPGFDPQGLILAQVADGAAAGAIVGGIQAIKPLGSLPGQHSSEARHHIAWLAVLPEYRGRKLGNALLAAAEDYLYYCPVYFAAQNAPFYGILERLWAPWYGSTERMGVSAVNDKALVSWLHLRGYHVTDPGDVSMLAHLHSRERPADPGLARRGLRLEPINERHPWAGEEPFHHLRTWGHNQGRQYQGLVVADGNRAVGSVVWYPLPDTLTAALAWIGLDRPYRGLRYGSYLLDRALAEMANRGYLAVEIHVHSKNNPEAYALLRHRGFEVIDYWVNLVKT